MLGDLQGLLGFSGTSDLEKLEHLLFIWCITTYISDDTAHELCPVRETSFLARLALLLRKSGNGVTLLQDLCFLDAKLLSFSHL